MVDGKVEDIDDSNYFEREGKGFVRDLTNCFDFKGQNSSYLLGTFENGVYICVTDPYRDPAEVWETDLHFNYMNFSPYYVRANAVASECEGTTTKIYDFETGDFLTECQRIPNIQTTVCGDHIIQHDDQTHVVHISSLVNPSLQYKLEQCFSPCFNETILAHSTSSQLETIYLLRLSNQKRFSAYEVEDDIDTIKISRFNLFLYRADRQHGINHIDVLNFNCEHLYTITAPYSWTSDECLCDREIVTVKLRMVTYVVLDSIEGTCSTLTVPKPEGEEDDSERDDKWSDQARSDRYLDSLSEGYSFTIMEYPTDDEGNRTGARGVMKCCRRWTK
ncbi:hypothetical protein HDV00_011847 [Rhizophlyctis rosea]|nr:hypothetical protein HDV00_011847 [Rhizophlyctis rosea]